MLGKELTVGHLHGVLLATYASEPRTILTIVAGYCRLGTSILMAILASIFSRNILRRQVQLDGTGFLHVLWLIRNMPTIGGLGEASRLSH